MAPITFLAGYRFRGRAGALQDDGRLASLVVELAENYAGYHRTLSEQLEDIGGMPIIDNFDTDEVFVEAWDTMLGLVRAEIFMRNCVLRVRDGAEMTAQVVDPEHPLLGEDGRLAAFA